MNAPTTMVCTPVDPSGSSAIAHRLYHWDLQSFVEVVQFAFQPIVNIYNGVAMGFEALLRGHQAAGFHSIQEVFDTAYTEGSLFALDLLLLEKALRTFKTLAFHGNCKLFYNIDNRVLSMPDCSSAETLRIIKRCGVHPSMVVFEISERHQFPCSTQTKAVLTHYRNQHFKIAVDDFGSGFSGLQLLYHSEPDYIKIDRFFIEGIQHDPRKKLFVSKVINLAHILGITIIAEGIETAGEYFVCKEMGCDFAQGYVIQVPTTTVSDLSNKYQHIADFHESDRRESRIDDHLIGELLDPIPPVNIYASTMEMVFDMFRAHKNRTFFPVVNGNDEPLGIIRENDLKEFTYSKFGRDLLLNRSIGKSLLDFLTKCPVAEIYKSIEQILEIFSLDEHSESLIITRNGKYAGFLGTRALLRAVNEKNLAVARDQNPLTKLPGNNLINEFISRTLPDTTLGYVYVYFDFNNFKPFNDVYGFRQGDRAILLFADILRSHFIGSEAFIGHIGGDDFFVGKAKTTHDLAEVGEMRSLTEKFSSDVQSLYAEEDRTRGYLEAHDREGAKARFPLLSVSAAILHLPPARKVCSPEQLSILIAELKHRAKRSTCRLATATL